TGTGRPCSSSTARARRAPGWPRTSTAGAARATKRRWPTPSRAGRSPARRWRPTTRATPPRSRPTRSLDEAVLAQPSADLGARERGPDEVDPLLLRGRALARVDAADVAGLERVVELDHLVVDHRAHAGVADLGVHGEGEVEGRRARGQD